jgi:hypothetical protein
MKEEKGKWESLIRSKIYDFEVDTNPEDWDLIVSRLPEGKVVPFRPYRRYARIAAAAVAALLLVGGLYFYMNDEQSGADPVATVEKPVGKEVDPVKKPVIMPADTVEQAQGDRREASMSDDAPLRAESSVRDVTSRTPAQVESSVRDAATVAVAKIPTPAVPWNEEALLSGSHRIDPENSSFDERLLAVVTPDLPVSKETKRRRWGFGMGGGGLGAGSNTAGMNVRSQSISLGEDEYEMQPDAMFLRSGGQDSEGLFEEDEGAVVLNEVDAVERSLGKIEHKMPISAGLGVNYFLNDRWALQSGVVYTLFRSTGSYTNSLANYAEWKQNLHFVGIPLSATYKIAEWDRLQVYATGGGMCEFNVSGKLKETVIAEDLHTIRNERMKKPLWSVNTRAGIDYAIWKIIYGYVEGGVSYYFDNHSDMETIRSEKPFNLSLQAGLRLSF